MSNLKQTLYEGDWLRLVRIDHWESCERTHGQGMAVIIIAVTPADEVLFVEQFRVPLQARTIEMPAGLVGDIHAGESIEVSAIRELEEETGYRAREWARAGVLHPVVSYSTEFIEIWFARGLMPGERRLDEGEFLDVFTASAEQLLGWCRDGQVTDAKTLIGALWLQNVRSGAWTLDWQAAPTE